jgi:hypothetical protein
MNPKTVAAFFCSHVLLESHCLLLDMMKLDHACKRLSSCLHGISCLVNTFWTFRIFSGKAYKYLVAFSGTTQIHLEHFGNVMPRQSVQDQKVLTLLCRNTPIRFVTVIVFQILVLKCREFHLHHDSFTFSSIRVFEVLITSVSL